MRRLLLLVPFLSGILSSCGGILGPEHRGSFSATVEGALSRHLDGSASAGETGGTVGSGYFVDLVARDRTAVFLRFPKKPPVGTYAMGTHATPVIEGLEATYQSETNGGFFHGVSGEVRITASGRRGLKGEFEFTARTLDATPRTVRIVGSFEMR